MVGYNDLPLDLKQKMEEENTHILVLTTPAGVPCIKCKATVRSLTKKEIPFTVSASLDNPEHLDFMLTATNGQRIAPGVIVFNTDGSIYDAWGDLRETKIEALRDSNVLYSA